jgi:transcriptional regulator of acetoin/glycerol metabolism
MNAPELIAIPLRTTEASRAANDHHLLVAAARRQVGSVDIPDLTDVIREAMVREALEREGGNITHAADLLGITRQAVQQLIRRFDLGEWQRGLRGPDGHSSAPSDPPRRVLPFAR